jgi:hypothetical protein
MVVRAMSLAGGFMVLGAYFALQRGWLAGADRLFNVRNFAGAGMLTWVAVEDEPIGFILLGEAWALPSAPRIVRARAASDRGRASGS